MIRVNIAEAKATLSRLLRAARAGEKVIICERNVPIAELNAVVGAVRKKRTLGPERPEFALPDSFFDPLPEELQRAFEGHGS